MQLRVSILATVIVLSFSADAQVSKYPKNYFRNPLDIPIQLAANFGEIRPNHWHMGLDIKTNHHENLPVYAAADGYISKTRVEPAGFGQAVFINHPNGLTTIYGHLNSFAPALQQYVINQQYKQESWQTDIELPSALFPVKKGQLIAYSGNTGGSQGPHLHFEIRDTKTTRCLNPLLFDFPLPDNVPPDIVRLAMYNRGISVYEQSPKLFPVKKREEGYVIPQVPVIKTGFKKISFAIQARDRNSGSTNPNGIYGAILFFDNKPVVNFFIDSIDYIETRAINAQVDYKYQYNGGVALQHISQLPGDHSGIYNHISGDGVLALNDAEVHTVRIEVKDANLNTSTISFQVQYDDDLAKTLSPHIEHQRFNPNFVSTWEENDFELYLPETVLYDTIQPGFVRNNMPLQDAVSLSYKFCDASIPAGDYFTVKIKPNTAISEALKDRLMIKNDYGTKSTIKKAEWQNGWIIAKFDAFGTYQAFADVLAPEINFPGKGDTADLSSSSRIVFWPTDNFGIKSFRAELDGKWLRFTNDKGRAYIYNFDEKCSYGVHELKVTVTDLAGNVTTKSGWFKKYEYTAPKKKTGKKKSTGGKKKARPKKREK
jgi:murein DD-endopeptidase MepM/ murein hydrolase activator NlpD